MSYVKTVWETGDVITAEKLNNLENGVEAVGSGVLSVGVNEDGETLKSKWQEIYDAMSSGKSCFITIVFPEFIGTGVSHQQIFGAYVDDGSYLIYSYDPDEGSKKTYITDSADGYPVFSTT